MKREVPYFIDVVVIPIINIMVALFVSGVIIFIMGENPFEALYYMMVGSLGDVETISYTLYYATNFIFTGLAVSLSFNAMLFNIGGEGQAYMGGLGIILAMLLLDSVLPSYLLIPIGIIFAGIFGAFWGAVPGILQAYKGSHIVITTIMFNFIASALITYLVVNHLIAPNQQSPITRDISDEAKIPYISSIFESLGISFPQTPLNLTFIFALICALLVYIYIKHTKYGYEVRVVGASERVALYGGIEPKKVIVLTMFLSGMLAGFMAINEIMGVHHKLILGFVAGYGFAGISVSLIGRNHPFGIVIASILFGALYQGGAELSFEIPSITKEIVVVIQGLVILFAGAFAYMLKPLIDKIYIRLFTNKAKVE